MVKSPALEDTNRDSSGSQIEPFIASDGRVYFEDDDHVCRFMDLWWHVPGTPPMLEIALACVDAQDARGRQALRRPVPSEIPGFGPGPTERYMTGPFRRMAAYVVLFHGYPCADGARTRHLRVLVAHAGTPGGTDADSLLEREIAAVHRAFFDPDVAVPGMEFRCCQIGSDDCIREFRRALARALDRDLLGEGSRSGEKATPEWLARHWERLAGSPPPDPLDELLDAERDADRERELLVLLDKASPKQRKRMFRILSHLREGLSMSDAKKEAARECRTTVHALDVAISRLRAVASDR